MSLKAQIGAIAILIAVVVGGWFWTTGGQDGAGSVETQRKRSGATLVLTEPLELAEDKIVVRAIGTGEALKSASLYPSVAGQVLAVEFTAEERVAAGKVLVRLDDKHQRLAVRLAKVALKEAGRQVRRLEKLTPTGVSSIARLQTVQAEYESAGLRLDQAKAALEDRTVRAPFAGIIGLTEIAKGDRVTEQTLIATLDDRSTILVEFNLPEAYAARVKVGDKVKLRPWSMRDREFTGVISATGSRIDPVTRSLKVKVRIDNPNDRLRPGISFEVSLEFKGGTYPSVREVAVLWSRDGAYLWRMTADKAEKVFVKIVRRDRGRILVDGPLSTRDTIVVEGVQGLRIGQRLKAKPFGGGKFDGAPAARPGKRS